MSTFLAALQLITLAGIALAVITLVGVAVIACAPAAWRARLIPASAVVGFAATAVLLHLLGIVLPVGVAIWMIAACAVVVIVVRRARGALTGRATKRAFGAFGVVTAIGFVGAAIAWVPSLVEGVSTIVQTTGSNDAFYYVSASSWFTANPLTAIPDIGLSPHPGGASPAFGDTPVTLAWGLRVGQELVSAGFASIMGVSTSTGFTAWIGLWVLIIPAACWVLAETMGLRPGHRAALGVILVTLASVQAQVMNQNADSIAAISLVLMIIATTQEATRPRVGQAPFPLWIAGVLVAAAVGTYTEYLPVAGVVLAAVVLIGPVRGLAAALWRSLLIVLISAVIGPLIWYRAIRSLLVATTVAGTPNAPRSPTDLALSLLGPLESVARGTTESRWLTFGVWILVVLVLAGLIGGLVVRRTRPLTIGAFASAAITAYLVWRASDYVTIRATAMATPLVIAAATIGFCAAADGLAGRLSGKSKKRVAAVVSAAVAVGVVAVNVTWMGRQFRAAAPTAQTVGADFDRIATIASKQSGPMGRNLTVASATLFDQLWLSDALRLDGQTSYVNLRGDLGYRGNTELLSYWHEAPSRFVLTGPGSYTVSGSGAVVAAEGRFRLLDSSKGGFTTVVPVEGGTPWSWTVGRAGEIAGGSGGSIQILHTGQASTPVLSLAGPAGSSVRVFDESGRTVGSAEASTPDGAARIPLHLPAGHYARRLTIELLGAPQQALTMKGLLP